MRRPLVLFLVLTVWMLVAGPPEPAAAHHASLSLGAIVRKVGRVYGDARPRVVHAEKTWTESTNEPMYVLELRGSFRRGRARAAYLSFSALTDRWYVWGVEGYDARHHLQWRDATVKVP